MMMFLLPTKKMSKVLIMRGLPASGKTTYAKELVKKEGYKRVNKDDIREMVDSSIYSHDNERLVCEIRNAIIDLCLLDGKNVVVDDTNFNAKHIKDIRDIAKLHEAPVEIKTIDTPIEECITRDMLREKSVGASVIKAMYDKYKP